MSDDSRDLLAIAVRRLLRPLVKLLLRHGVAYGAFAELARKAYVDVAFEEYPGSNKRPSVSSVAALTGLTRKEVKRLHELHSPDSVLADQRYNRSIRVISGWLNDPLYCHASGDPARLPLNKGDNSFASLVKKYSGDIPCSAMLSVLEAANSVHSENGHVALLQHAFIPTGNPDDKINILGVDVAELIATIDHNLTAPEQNLRFQRKVSNTALASTAVPAFRKLAAKKAQKLLEDLDGWLARHELNSEQQEEDSSQYVAMGIYYTEHPPTPGGDGE